MEHNGATWARVHGEDTAPATMSFIEGLKAIPAVRVHPVSSISPDPPRARSPRIPDPSPRETHTAGTHAMTAKLSANTQRPTPSPPPIPRRTSRWFPRARGRCGAPGNSPRSSSTSSPACSRWYPTAYAPCARTSRCPTRRIARRRRTASASHGTSGTRTRRVRSWTYTCPAAYPSTTPRAPSPRPSPSHRCPSVKNRTMN